jgi:hypothetical protein
MFESRKTRTVAQGRRKLTRERDEYFRLVQQRRTVESRGRG